MTEIPTYLQTSFLTETQSGTAPEITRENRTVYFPAFIRETEGTYRYFRVPVPYAGQQIADYDRFAVENYAAIRAYFYGTAQDQADLEYHHLLKLHIAAVKQAFPKPASAVTMDDYDGVMEAHLTAELFERGYTERSPIEYTNSTNARWKSDASDWQTHLDAVMNYGLSVMNDYSEGKAVPALEEFRAALPKITWSMELA